MSKFKHNGSKIYKPKEFNITPYDDMIEKFEKEIGDKTGEKKTWKFVAIFSLVITFISIIGGLLLWFYTANLPDSVIHVIEVAPWGEAKYIGEIGQANYDIRDDSIKHYLERFVIHTRSISTDKYIVKDYFEDAFFFVTQTGSNLLKNELNTNDPFIRAEKERVEVVIESKLPVTKDVWQIDWIEKIQNITGSRLGTRRYRGLYSLYFTTPNEKQKNANPLGIFIDDYNITELKMEKGE